MLSYFAIVNFLNFIIPRQCYHQIYKKFIKPMIHWYNDLNAMNHDVRSLI